MHKCVIVGINECRCVCVCAREIRNLQGACMVMMYTSECESVCVHMAVQIPMSMGV